MRLFKRLAEIISPVAPQETVAGFQIPFDLSPPQWDRLKALREHPDWPLFLRALDETTIFAGEAMVSGAKDESLHFYRGMVLGLRKAGTLLDEAVQHEQQWKNDAAQRTRRREPGDRNFALFGSPGWNKRT